MRAAYKYVADSADVTVRSGSGIKAERFNKENHVVTRCLGRREIAACSFDLCQSEPSRLDVRPVTCRCSKGGGVIACSFERRQVKTCGSDLDQLKTYSFEHSRRKPSLFAKCVVHCQRLRADGHDGVTVCQLVCQWGGNLIGCEKGAVGA